MTDGVDASAPPEKLALLARVERAGIDATAPREERCIDGWLVRLSPGRAKRARCIQPIAPGRLSIDEKLALCLPLYAAAGLHPYLRITRFAEPPGLDARLDALGMARIDDSMVMTVESLAMFEATGRGTFEHDPIRLESIDAAAFADWIGRARGSPAPERAAHADRLARVAVPHHAVVAKDGSGVTVAAGQIAVDGSLAGLYDIFTTPAARGRGFAERVCRHLLGHARARGASVGYLQVDAANDVARRLYRRLGFRDGYPYHYRTTLPVPG